MCGYEDLRGRTFNPWDSDSLKAEVDSGPVCITYLECGATFVCVNNGHQWT